MLDLGKPTVIMEVWLTAVRDCCPTGKRERDKSGGDLHGYHSFR
jgi:hypothetical protein